MPWWKTLRPTGSNIDSLVKFSISFLEARPDLAMYDMGWQGPNIATQNNPSIHILFDQPCSVDQRSRDQSHYWIQSSRNDLNHPKNHNVQSINNMSTCLFFFVSSKHELTGHFANLAWTMHSLKARPKWQLSGYGSPMDSRKMCLNMFFFCSQNSRLWIWNVMNWLPVDLGKYHWSIYHTFKTLNI